MEEELQTVSNLEVQQLYFLTLNNLVIIVTNKIHEITIHYSNYISIYLCSFSGVSCYGEIHSIFRYKLFEYIWRRNLVKIVITIPQDNWKLTVMRNADKNTHAQCVSHVSCMRTHMHYLHSSFIQLTLPLAVHICIEPLELLQCILTLVGVAS